MSTSEYDEIVINHDGTVSIVRRSVLRTISLEAFTSKVAAMSSNGHFITPDMPLGTIKHYDTAKYRVFVCVTPPIIEQAMSMHTGLHYTVPRPWVAHRIVINKENLEVVMYIAACDDFPETTDVKVSALTRPNRRRSDGWVCIKFGALMQHYKERQITDVVMSNRAMQVLMGECAYNDHLFESSDLPSWLREAATDAALIKHINAKIEAQGSKAAKITTTTLYTGDKVLGLLEMWMEAHKDTWAADIHSVKNKLPLGHYSDLKTFSDFTLTNGVT